MLRQCVGIKGKGCSRFIADWDNHSLCFACRVCSQNNPCEVCSVWTTFLWSKASAAKAKADSKRSNLCKVGETVQQVGSSRDSSLPFSEGNEGPVAKNHTVVGVEVPSSQALALTGSNPGALSSEISTAGNSTGNSSQPSCQKVPDSCSGTSRPRSRSPSEHPDLAISHDDRSHGSRARSRRSHCTSQVVRRFHKRTAYAQGADLIALPGTIDRRGSERSLGGSRAHSPRAYGYRAMRSHSRRSRQDDSPNYRSRRGQRSRLSRRSHRRRHGCRSHGRDRSRSYSRSNHSRSMSRESRSRHVDNPISQATRSSEFSGFSANDIQDQRVQPGDGIQPDMWSLIRQLLAEEFKTFSGSRKRLRSRSTSVERVPVRSHTAPDPDPMDEHNTACVQGSMGNSSGKVIPSEKTIPNNLNQASSNYEEPEIQITPLPGETIGSDDNSDDQDQEKQEDDESGTSEQASGSAQLPYFEALESLRARLGTHLCPDIVQKEPKSGASALDFFDKKSRANVLPVLPESRLILDSISKINSRIQGPNPIQGSPLDSYPKGLMTNRFPSLHMKPKVFSQESYKISDPTMVIDHPPIDPSFREVLKQGALFPTYHSLQLQQLEGWEKLARAGIHINSHAGMFLYGILSALNSPAPSQTDLVEVRRYLQALAQSHMHMFDVLVRLASGLLLARRDAYLDKCALDASV